jgi:hypothetical protein
MRRLSGAFAAFVVLSTVSLAAPAVAGGATLPPGGTFVDDDGSIHEAMIEAIAAVGITRGCMPDGRYFCPSEAVTRGQMAAFLKRAFPVPDSTVDAFVDDETSVFELDIDAVAADGILRGCNPPRNDRVCPDAPVTREQMATMLVRAAHLPPSASGSFTDIGGSVHAANIRALAAAGVTYGCDPPGNDRFCPFAPVSRAQMASFLGRALHLVPLQPPPPLIALGTSCIDERVANRPSGTLAVVPGDSPAFGTGTKIVTFIVETEVGLPVDPDCFARVVELTLGDHRSWIGSGDFSIRRVDSGPADLRVTLASPDTVDRYCAPLRTAGIYSCWDGSRAMLNFMRWEFGASDFGDDLIAYRTYQINHEVGHGLGHGHLGCTGEGDLAPVMMQQTKTVGSCVPNGWPTARELRR